MSLPGWAAWALRRLTPPEIREELLGDVTEEWNARGRARGWLLREVLRSAAPLVGMRIRRRPGKTIHGRGRAGTMERLRQDVRFGLRSLGRQWGFTGLVVLVLALGIGANGVTFSVVNGTVLNPFPFPEPDRIVGVGTGYPRIGEELGFWENLSPAEFRDVQGQSRLLEDIVSWDMGFREIDTDGPPTSTFSAFWWGNALETLGMDAHLGRGFTEDEIREGARVALLSHRFWTTHFGADSSLVGGTISVAGDPFTLVGILPEGVLIYGTDFWMPMPSSTSAYPRNRRQFQVLARVAEGVELAAVNAELETIARRVEADHAAEFQEYRDWRMEARTWTDVNVSTLRTAATILMAAVGFLLLLVCVNVANMLLARATGRRREMAVRRAMGAGRGRLVGQLLTESLLLAGLGGALGIGLTWLGTRGASRFLTTLGLPIPGTVRLDAAVVAFTAVAALAAAVIFGLVPALHAAREGVGATLGSESGRTTGQASRQRLLRIFVSLEVAVALLLLVSGGLLVRSLVSLSSVDPGWETKDVLTLRVTLPPSRYGPEEIEAFYPALLDRLQELPGVRSAATATQFPGRIFSRSRFAVEGRVVEGEEELPAAFTTLASRGFFETVGMRVLEGRVPSPGTDGPDDPPVAVINEAGARAFFSDEWIELVGVVANTRNRGLDQPPAPELFASQEQLGGPNQFFFLIRTEGDPLRLLPAIREAVAASDPDQPIYGIQTAAEVYRSQSAPRRATAMLLGIFAFFALTLAAAGIYGVVSYSVAARTREIGVRLALGARGRGVRRMVVRQALLPVALGLAVGLTFSFAAAQLLGGLLHGVESNDLTTRAVVASLLLLVAVAASWIPALRASRLDPAATLRRE